MVAAADEQYLVCSVSDEQWAFPLSSVVEVMRPLPVEHLAAMPDFVLGVSIIRGSAVPIVDAASLLSGIGTHDAGRLLVLRVNNRTVGLAVGAIRGIRTISGTTVGELPPLLRTSNADAVSAIATLDTHFLRVLDAARMIPDAVWEQWSVDGAPP